MGSKSKSSRSRGLRLESDNSAPTHTNANTDGEGVTLEAMAQTLDMFAGNLTARGFPITAHFVEIAALDLKCRVKGIAEHEIATLGLLARHVFERKWAARRIAKPTANEK